MSSDDDRFIALYRRHHRDVVRYARRRVDAETADDVTAETFLVALRRLDAVPDDPLPWLYGVARRAVANADRSRRRAGRLDARLAVDESSRVGATPDPADRIGERDALGQALGRLSAQDQELVRLVAWEGLGLKEAARVLGCTPATAAVRLHRARRRLANEIESAVDQQPLPASPEVTR